MISKHSVSSFKHAAKREHREREIGGAGFQVMNLLMSGKKSFQIATFVVLIGRNVWEPSMNKSSETGGGGDQYFPKMF